MFRREWLCKYICNIIIRRNVYGRDLSSLNSFKNLIIDNIDMFNVKADIDGIHNCNDCLIVNKECDGFFWSKTELRKKLIKPKNVAPSI